MKKIRVLFLFLSHCLRSILSPTAAGKAAALHATAQKLLQILELQVTLGQATPPPTAPLWIANHTGFWDIILLSSIRPVRFITSNEMKNTPVLGFVCRISGCFFMDRQNPHRLRSEIKALHAELSADLPLVLFPEGTTSDGASIQEFKRGLLRFIRTQVQPWVISFEKTGTRPFSREDADRIFYFGDHSFLGQALNVFKLEPLSARIDAVTMGTEHPTPDEFREAMLKRHRAPSS